MTDANQIEPTRRGRPPNAEGREDRAGAIQSDRRRRKSDAVQDPFLRPFAITPDVLDHDTFAYRSEVEDGARLQNLTVHDDWDFVTRSGGKASAADDTGVLRYQSGTVDGKPQYTYLLRKLKKFAEEDRAAKDAKIAALERARQTPADAPENAYKPR